MRPGADHEPTPAPALPGSSWALAAGLAIVCVWGANFAVQKALFQVLPPAGLLFARYLLMPVCAALLLMCSPGGRKAVPRADMLQIAFLGVLGHSVHVTMVTFGIHWSTAFSSALILACGPIFTLLILHWAGHERLSWPQVAGVGIACVGVLVFLSEKLLGQQWAATGGDLMMLPSDIALIEDADFKKWVEVRHLPLPPRLRESWHACAVMRALPLQHVY